VRFVSAKQLAVKPPATLNQGTSAFKHRKYQVTITICPCHEGLLSQKSPDFRDTFRHVFGRHRDSRREVGSGLRAICWRRREARRSRRFTRLTTARRWRSAGPYGERATCSVSSGKPVVEVRGFAVSALVCFQ